MQRDIAVSVIITTRNEEYHLARCLRALSRFDEIIVVDSGSVDGTAAIARSFGVPVVAFNWNGRYPKKRQWCLDTLSLKHDRVFFVDADEEVTPALCNEIAGLDWRYSGYFVRGAYVVDGTALRFGLKNNKLCLFDRSKVAFPVVDDLDVPGMGEIEGHYQPVPTGGDGIGQVKEPLLHHALEQAQRWRNRHAGYADWQREVYKKLPQDPVAYRRWLKRIFERLPFQPWLAFAHSYIALLGFLDGRRGWVLARSRHAYYSLLGR